MHLSSSFVTLTYSNEKLPSGASLVPKDVELWLKRLRLAVAPAKLRYYLVGEYGSKTERPHYHLALFGLGMMDAQVIHDTWGMGHVVVGELNPQSAQYIAGYVTKGYTKKEDKRLCGRYPEFARMSRRPGIGATAMHIVAQSIQSYGIRDLVKVEVPRVLAHGKKKMPLGRYLKQRLRVELGIDEEAAKEKTIAEFAIEMREMFKDSFADEENASKSLAAILVSKNGQRILNVESRYNIFKKKEIL